jgi:hypothetical protein
LDRKRERENKRANLVDINEEIDSMIQKEKAKENRNNSKIKRHMRKQKQLEEEQDNNFETQSAHSRASSNNSGALDDEILDPQRLNSSLNTPREIKSPELT